MMDKLGDDGLVVDGRKLFFEYRYFVSFRALPIVCTFQFYLGTVNYNNLIYVTILSYILLQ